MPRKRRTAPPFLEKERKSLLFRKVTPASSSFPKPARGKEGKKEGSNVGRGVRGTPPP